MWLSIIKYVAVSVILTLIASAGWYWKNAIEKSSIAAYEKQQLQQTLKEQEKQLKDLTEINALQIKSIKNLNDKNKELDDKLKSLDEYLDSKQAIKDSERYCVNKDGKKLTLHGSSLVLKRTVKELSGVAK